MSVSSLVLCLATIAQASDYDLHAGLLEVTTPTGIKTVIAYLPSLPSTVAPGDTIGPGGDLTFDEVGAPWIVIDDPDVSAVDLIGSGDATFTAFYYIAPPNRLPMPPPLPPYNYYFPPTTRPPFLLPPPPGSGLYPGGPYPTGLPLIYVGGPGGDFVFTVLP